MNAKTVIRDAEQRLMTEAHKEWKDASAVELHNAISGAAMDAIASLWKKKEDARFPHRKAAYLSMEFLVGRLVYNNLYCMGLLEDAKKLFAEVHAQADAQQRVPPGEAEAGATSCAPPGM